MKKTIKLQEFNLNGGLCAGTQALRAIPATPRSGVMAVAGCFWRLPAVPVPRRTGTWTYSQYDSADLSPKYSHAQTGRPDRQDGVKIALAPG
jgi:hypothetical protein